MSSKQKASLQSQSHGTDGNESTNSSQRQDSAQKKQTTDKNIKNKDEIKTRIKGSSKATERSKSAARSKTKSPMQIEETKCEKSDECSESNDSSVEEMSQQIHSMKIEDKIKESESTKTNTKNKAKFNPEWTNPKSASFRPWAAPATRNDQVFDKFCNKTYHIASLYGANGHLTKKTHMVKEEEYYASHPEHRPHGKNTLQQPLEKAKSFEYALCSLLIRLNLPFLDDEPIFECFTKFSNDETSNGLSMNC